MTHPVLLNNVDHKDLRIITAHGARYGDNVMTVFAFAPEFRNLQAHYPIVFYKSADGSGFQSAALLGFEEGENLFLGMNGWDAAYVPLAIQRQPFLIGESQGEMVMHIDMESSRVSTSQGESVFLEFGGNTDYLTRMNSVLLAIHQGAEGMPDFQAALQELELLESFVFDIEMADGMQNRLTGFYTINEERLSNLSGAVLERLNRLGYLQPIYMVIASLSNLRALAERKYRAHAASL